MSTAARPTVSRRALVQMGGMAAICTILGASGGRIGHASEADGQKAAYATGTYEGTGTGRKGPITVEVTFGSESIEAIEVTESHETPRIANAAYQALAQAIVDDQTLAVDTVAGATLCSVGFLNAVEDCCAQAGADVDALKAPTEKATPEAQTIECDIAVVGAGAAGVPAALEAAMKGAKVVVFEKTAYIGGNALVSGGVLTYIDAPHELRHEMTDGLRDYFEQTLDKAVELGLDQSLVDAVREQYEQYFEQGNTDVFDSVEWQAIYNCVAVAPEAIDDALYQSMLAYSQSNIALMDWLEQFDVGYGKLMAVGGYPWPDNVKPAEGECGEGWFAAFDRYVETNKPTVEFLMSTPADELLVEDGRVTGVRGTCADGTTYEAHASKGVILATGGFSGSRELMVEHDDGWDFASYDVIPTTNGHGHTGDGLTMALAAGGAYVDNHPNYMMMPFANGVDYSIESQIGDGGNCLFVNKEGQRFVDETLSRNEICQAEMAQTDGSCFLISDAKNCAIEGELNSFGMEVELLIETGKGFRAQTLDELAKQIGIDADEFAATIERYNGFAASGVDEDFGRTLFDENTPVDTPPFYASPCHWASHITNSGVSVDWDTYRVLDADDQPVEGLYAAGEVTPVGGGIDVMADGIAAADSIMGA